MKTDTVTRLEIVEAVGEAFGVRGADRSEILAAAATEGARPEVIAALQRLPQRRFRVVNELWEDLGHLPVG